MFLENASVCSLQEDAYIHVELPSLFCCIHISTSPYPSDLAYIQTSAQNCPPFGLPLCSCAGSSLLRISQDKGKYINEQLSSHEVTCESHAHRGRLLGLSFMCWRFSIKYESFFGTTK
jgi:hypothetical protein